MAKPKEIPESTESEKAWLAGILEGEAWIGIRKQNRREHHYEYPIIVVCMTDEDIVERVAKLMGNSTENVKRPDYRLKQWKPQFRTQLQGRTAVKLLNVLYPWFGVRRKAMIDGFNQTNVQKP